MEDTLAQVKSPKDTARSDNSLEQTIGQDVSAITHTFIKIILKETDDIVLFENPSETVPRDSEEAAAVISANERYEYLTKGKGRNRRTTNSETQTVDCLYKSRAVNTDRIKQENIGTFVSNYEMFDTYEDLARSTQSLEVSDETKIVVTTYAREGEDDLGQFLNTSANFRHSAMIIQRLLAGNVFREKQKRFRNMYLPDPLAMDVKYHYTLEKLWSYQWIALSGYAVTSFSWCETNRDILAVGYGLFYLEPNQEQPDDGYVCIWSIKNPVNPERKFKFNAPVTALAFSPFYPQMLAVGLYDGSLEIRDFTDEYGTLITSTDRENSLGFESIWQINWLPGEGIFSEYGQLLTISVDGRIMKYSFTSGPYLSGIQLLRLSRVEGVVEGLPIAKKKDLMEAYRHPQALCLRIHPLRHHIYFVGTDEGCLHTCSLNYPQHHVAVCQVHKGSVYSIEYSPWSPKIFLTCGSDWCIRVWVEGIFKPVIELSSGFNAVNCAFWSPIHATIIASCSRDRVELWDIRRKTLKPASTHTFDSAPLTKIKFSKCGRSLIVGTADGTVHVCALENMPFPPHFQYIELQKAIYGAISGDLFDQVKSLGHLGYPTEKKKRPTSGST
ncbi:dynein axonemal intermediate chain 4 [Phlebotomus papatasi]|uniref:dynein axonemal intermediate chain 4 n=1 Tax=Phlebotomus papatasi TaxID=29031 RepID=UPI0024846053|nr:dynein axonemal intermediate chain 4 [Phlebotomus papatasi]